MTYRQLLARVANPALSILLVLATACTHQSQPKQERLPPRTQDRPLQDRIKSQERPERESWQKPDEVVRALALPTGRSSPTSAPGPAISPAAWPTRWRRTARSTR